MINLLMNIVNILKAQPIELSLHKQILDKLYNSFEHKHTRYEICKTNEQLQFIKNNNLYVSAQFQGVAYILFFCLIKLNNGMQKKMHILIPKKDLKETNEKNKLNEIKMYNIFIPFVFDEYYNGTILDGKMVKNNSMNKIEHSFIIHEIYYNLIKHLDLKEKLEIIKTKFLPNFNKLNCKFIVVRLYEQHELSNLFDKLSLSKNKVIGLMFLNRISNQYYVYTNEREFDLLRLKMPLPKQYNYDSYQEFIMKSTKITDVYYLYDINDNSNVGLAGIPNIATSHFYANLFKTETSIKVKCIKSDKFLKWIPLIDDCYNNIIDVI